MSFSTEIIKWYSHNKRELPWRNTKNPYYIWLSEIILQQTRVQQGLPYYQKFITQFPTVRKLASAEEELVLKLWQGLGYYSRARNLHATSKLVVKHMGGKFPETKKELLQLKGVGEYTASAIASFCFKEPVAVVDGNVYRLLSRYFGISTPIDSIAGKKEFAKIAQRELNQNAPDTHNQAIMEFGATVCTPTNPKCSDCSLKTNCVAAKNNLIEVLPIKEKKTKQRTRYFYYIFVTLISNDTFLIKRTQKDIWSGLYEFPLIEKSKPTSVDQILQSKEFQSLNLTNPTIKNISTEYKHQLSHQKIHAKFIHITATDSADYSNRITIDSVHDFPTHRLMEKYLDSAV